jgi:hypothetical protein
VLHESRLFELRYRDVDGQRAAWYERRVTFRFKDYCAKGRCRYKPMTLPVEEFMHRFLLHVHVLPHRFRHIRH